MCAGAGAGRGWEVGWGCDYFERSGFKMKSNARPPTATLYNTTLLRTKKLEHFRGTEGGVFAQDALQQAAETNERLSKIVSLSQKLNTAGRVDTPSEGGFLRF